MISKVLMRRVLLAAACLVSAGCEVKVAPAPSGGPPNAPTPTTGGSAAVPAGDAKLAGEIKINGSSTVFPITKAVSEAFREKHPDVRITVGDAGTGSGFKKFIAGEIDIADASRPISESEKKQCVEKGIEFVELELAKDGISIVVNKKNDWCKELTIAQLKAMWEPESKVAAWKDLNPAWPDKPIKLFGPDTASGTFEYFTEAVVGKKGASRSDYTQNTDDKFLVTGVSNDEYALGYFGFIYFEENQDALSAVGISPEEGKPALVPSFANIEDGTYAPLSRPVFMYVNKKIISRPDVKAFLEFYLSDDGQKIVATKAVKLPADKLAKTREVLAAGLK